MRKIAWSLIAVMIVATLVALLCHAPSSAAQPAADGKRVVAADNDFGLRLFAQLAKSGNGGNIFISPTSIALALQMTYNGAAGSTRRAMAKALGIDELTLDTLNQENLALLTEAQSPNLGIELNIANSLWANQGEHFKPAFLQRVKKYYQAEVTSLKLASAAPRINGWVSDKTQKKITQLVTPDDLQAAVMVLLNAVYFKGSWQQPFDKKLTADGDFTRADGKKTTLPMMHLSEGFSYLATATFQAIRLPYAKGQTSFVILLPKPGFNLKALEKTLTAANWDKWMNQFSYQQVDLTLPRFKVEYRTELGDPLSKLGMGEAFSPKANFTEMSDGRLFINKVIHKSILEVHETGTEAAAATAVIMTRGAMMPREKISMTVNHPFLCAIRNDKTGQLLFLGAIEKPTK
ncbi:MAG TPA: serpin family protein [Armatimonadota bacterium]|jgi:serpin B